VTPDTPGSAGPAATGVSKLNLLPETERPEIRWWRRWHLWVPLALVGAVALVAIVLPIWQKRDYAIALLRNADQARVQADASSALRHQLETMTGDYNFALGKKYAFPGAVQLLDDVTKLLPDDTWLTQLEVKSTMKGKERQREMLLRGESGNAGRLVSLLEDSKLFVEAAPRSPTTKIQPGPGEIFDLGALLKPVPAPVPLQLASMPAADLPAPSVAPAGEKASGPLPPPSPPIVAPASPPAPAALPPQSPPMAAPAGAPPPAAVPPPASVSTAPTSAPPAAVAPPVDRPPGSGPAPPAPGAPAPMPLPAAPAPGTAPAGPPLLMPAPAPAAPPAVSGMLPSAPAAPRSSGGKKS
jgi:hypothetical protein